MTPPTPTLAEQIASHEREAELARGRARNHGLTRAEWGVAAGAYARHLVEAARLRAQQQELPND